MFRCLHKNKIRATIIILWGWQYWPENSRSHIMLAIYFSHWPTKSACSLFRALSHHKRMTSTSAIVHAAPNTRRKYENWLLRIHFWRIPCSKKSKDPSHHVAFISYSYLHRVKDQETVIQTLQVECYYMQCHIIIAITSFSQHSQYSIIFCRSFISIAILSNLAIIIMMSFCSVAGVLSGVILIMWLIIIILG